MWNPRQVRHLPPVWDLLLPLAWIPTDVSISSERHRNTPSIMLTGTTKVGGITKKVQEISLKWYGHVMRREEHYVGRRAMVLKVQGRRKRGRHKRRWLDKVKDDIREKGLSADDVYDRATWRRMSSYVDPT